ncbi:MAG: ribbon-helix-helix domain-containing protein [Thermoplasmatota archaeon]
MPAMILTPPQEAWLDGLVEAGIYQNTSEALRAGVDALRAKMEPSKRMAAAIEAYRDGKCSISLAAMMANAPHRTVYEPLQREGILRLGFADPAASGAAGKRLAKAVRDKTKGAWQGE